MAANRSMTKLLNAFDTVNNKVTFDSDSTVTSASKGSNLGAGISTVTNVSDLPSVAQAYSKILVTGTNTLYQYSTGGWYPIAIINNFNPAFTTSPDATYSLSLSGAATTVTVLATDSDDVPIKYITIADSDFSTFATISHDSDKHNVFTVIPIDSDGSNSGDKTGTVTFRASDGVNVSNANSTFTLTFGPSGGNPLFYVEGEGSSDKWGMTGQGGGTSFFSSLDISSGHFIIGAPSHDSNKGKAYLYSYTDSGSTAIRTHVQTYYSFLGMQVAVNTTAGKYAIGELASGGGQAGQLRVFNISDGSLAWGVTRAQLSGSPTTGYWPGTWSDIQMTDTNLYIGQADGAVRSFALSNGSQNWVVTKPTSGFYFGTDISVDESTNRLITAEKTAAPNQRGEAYIYNTTNGSLVKTIANPEQSSGSDYDQFGAGVALKGNYAIIGAPGEDTGAGSAGKVFLYTTSDNWANVTQVRSHAAPVAVTNGNFGHFVEISDTHYYVSNFKEDNGGSGAGGGGVSGVIYVYKISDGTLEFTLGKTTDAFTSVQNGNFGAGLSLDGNNLLASQGMASWDPSYLPRAYVFK
jgi:hypothetical protein